ncbi:murein hydrolase activator EnvC family protein [Ectobacillus ponti]|uniref:Peptidoglycan DD-metalloendopeptidase family protein n=1 Tax=Ectobacillus ponti TaxID=2961894 RepID=A0AA42BTB0_9BACI|nr:M23 family metallopeptidase [Ectobacillus ponti]MCP8969283.1 peptidoglycan DD-metalloendopeptidase family protein [Ectobacillus ponti]
MKGRRLHIALAAGLLLTPAAMPSAQAESAGSIEQTIRQKAAEKQVLQEQMDQLKEQVQQFDLAMEKNQLELEHIQNEMHATEDAIAEKKQSIQQLQIKIEQRQDVLKKRLAALQTQPRTSMVTDILLETKSFADLLDKLYSVNLIFQSDQQILNQQQEDQTLLGQQMKSVEEKKTVLRSLKSDLQAKQTQLEENQKQKEAVLQTLLQQFQQTVSEMMSAEEEKQVLQAQAAAAAALAREAKQKRTLTVSPAPVAPQAASPSASAGFIKPAAGAYSSGFGSRSDGNHKGLDIAASGTVPIAAAAAGTVIRSYYSASYGNVVFISHRIHGQAYTTVYAHMRTRTVSAGQSVSQGQQIGIMGNTGMSEGQHLHFEVHEGDWNLAKSNAVDPRKYLP